MERLSGAATKKTDKKMFLVLLRYVKAITPFVVFIFYFCYGLACLLCFRTRYASISLASYLD